MDAAVVLMGGGGQTDTGLVGFWCEAPQMEPSRALHARPPCAEAETAVLTALETLVWPLGSHSHTFPSQGLVLAEGSSGSASG